MDEQYQITIPPSFMAIYSRNGRPNESRRVIEERYDLCEDMAVQTSEFCHQLQFKDDLPESAVLLRCHATLLEGAVVTPPETDWVVSRVAELLQWALPTLPERPPAA